MCINSYLKKLLVILFLFVFSCKNDYAQTTGDFRSLATGNWSASGTWQRYSSTGVWQNTGVGENSPGQVPGVGVASGNVTVQNGHTVTLDISNATAIASLTVGGGASGILQFETATNRTLTITGNLSLLAFAQFNVQNLGSQAGSVIVGGNLSNAGTMNFRQSATRYSDLTINGNGWSGNGTYTAFRHITIGGAVTNTSASTINIYGNLTSNNTFTCSSGAFNFLSGGAQSITGTNNPTFNNFSIATNGTVVTLSGISAMNVNGTFTMTNTSTFDFGTTSARTVTVVGNLVTPQTITMTGAGLAHQLKLGGAANATPVTFTTTAGSGSIVEYNGAAQSVFFTANYRNLVLSGSGVKTFAGGTTVNNDMTISGTGITVSNANALAVSGNLTNSGTGTTTWGGNANTLTLTGNLLVTNNTTFTIGNTAAQLKTLNITGNVQVDAGSTLNNGAFAAVNLLSISGNLQVDGTFNMVQTFPGNVCNVTFSGASNNTVTTPGGTGTINFNQVTLTKVAVGNVLDVQAVITMSSPTVAGTYLTLTSGTFKLSSASTLTPYFGASTICAAAGGLWLNNSGANVSCVQTNTSANPGVPAVLGMLHVTAGTFSYGSGNDVMLVNSATSNLWIDGGTLNMYGGIAFTSTSQFNMTSGNLKIYPQGFDNIAAATTILSFGSTSAVNAVTFTGGTLTIVDPPVTGAGGTALFITPTVGYAYNFSGSTINLGDGVSNKNGVAAVGFTIDAGSRYALGNLVMNNGSSSGTNRLVRLLNTDCIITNSLVIGSNANDNFNLNGRTLTLNGILTVGTGTLTGSATSSIVIGGSNTPVMNLPPIVGGNLLSLTINKTGTNNTVNLGGSLTLAAAGILTLTSGILEIGNYNLTLSNNAAAAIAGSPFSSSNMITTDGTGYLIKNVASAQALNPIGNGTYYSPMTLTSITAGGTYSIRAVPASLNPEYMNVYWDFVTSTSPKTITATFQYDPAELNGANQVITYDPAPYTATQTPPASGVCSYGVNTFTITGNVSSTTGGYWTMGGSSTYYSYQTGDWNTPSTWTSDPSGTLQVGNTIPGFNDNVVILAGRTVSLPSNITTLSLNVTINSSGFIDMGGYSFTNGLSTLTGSGTIRLSSVNFPTVVTNTFVNSGGGTVEYYNSSSFTLPVAQTTYNNLTINCSGQTATQLSNLTLNGNLLVSSGTFRINDNTATRRQLTISGNFTVNSGAIVSVGNGVTNTTTNPTAVPTAVAGPFINYYDAQSHRVVVYGDFVNNGTVNFSNISYPIYNAFPPTIAGSTTGFATVYFRGTTNNLLTCNNTTNFYNIVVDKGTDQTYTLTINPSSYSNFKLFGANTAAADILMGASATNPNIKKAFWIRNGTVILQGSCIIPSLSEGNITAALPGTSDYYIPANGALTLNGPDVIVLTTSDDYQETNVAYGVSGGSGLVNGVIKGGYSSLYIYGKLTVASGYLSTRESGGIITNGGSGQVVLTGGFTDAKQFLNATSSTASFQMSGGLFTLRGRFQRTPTSYASTANLSDTAAATLNTSRAINGTSTGYGSFNINNAANLFTMTGGDIWIHDVCDAGPPATAPNAFDVNSSTANTNVTGGTITFLPTTGTALADETSFLISSTASLGNVIVNRQSGSSTVQLNSGFPLTVLSNMSILSGDFNANAQNLTVGGNFSIESGTTYTTGANTTTLNGSGTQAFTINIASPLSLNNLTFTKTAGVAVNLAGTQKGITVAGNFNLTLGTLNDNGDSILVAGTVYNSGLHSGTGKISLNGSASTQTIDGSGIFQNLELNNTNAASAPVSLLSNTTVNGTLTFSQNKLFNIGIYNLLMNASASFVNAGANRYAYCAGNAGDGGITKVYNSTSTFIFPLGAASTTHAGVPNYTPASIGLSAAPTAYGSITVVPVGYAHPNETTAGRSLAYFWRVRSSGFTLGSATITQGYTYSVNDVITGAGITENGYVAARYDVNTTSWTRGTTSDVDIVGKIIGEPNTGTFLENVAFIDGDYTAGDDNPTNPFGTPKVFYSYATGPWGNATSWTSDATRATWINIGTPVAADVVHIGAGHTISLGTPANYLTNANTDPRSCATLYVDAGSVLDMRYNPSSNLGIVMNSGVGNGKIRITTAQASNSTFTIPAGDFTLFNTNLGTTELYTTNPAAGTTYWMANGVTTYGNLLFSPLGGSNILFPNNSVLIYGNCTETGANADSWLLPCWTGAYPLAPTATVAKTITINGNLDIQGGSFGWYGNGAIAQNVFVNGNVSVCATCALDNWGGATNQTLTIGGNLTNDANGLTNGVSTTARVNLVNVPTTFNGNTSASITNTVGTPSTTFGTVTVNKGSSQATTLNCNIGGTLSTPADNWLTLQNGTFMYQRTNPTTNFTISTTTNITIPSTAGLYVNYTNSNNVNVLISNSGADASDLYLSGKLTVVNGKVYVGPTAASAFNNDIEYSGNSAAIQVDGGNLYVNGQIRRPIGNTNGSLSYTQTGGAVAINGNSSAGGLALAQTRAKLEVVNTGSAFNMSSGTITIARGSGSTFGDLYIRPASSTVTGGTIIFTNAAPNSIQNYTMDANTALYNLTVTSGGAGATNATVTLMTSPLILNGTLTFTNNKSFFNSNNKNVTINQDLVNNGIPGSYIYGTNLTTFSGATQNISGTSVTNFYDLTVSPSLSLTVNNSFTVNRNFIIGSGTMVLGANKVTVVSSGNFTNSGAYSDDNITGGVCMNGTSQQQISGTGSYQRLEINNTSGVLLQNDITLNHDLVLTNGIFKIQSYNLILNTGSSIGGSSFSSSKMIMTDGVATSEGLTKFFPVISSPTTFTYPVGVLGKYTPAVYSINASGSIGNINVSPINSYQPTVIDPTKVLQYYWSIASSGITGFDGSLILNYLSADVLGTESIYIAAWLQLPGTYWSKASVGPATDNVNETTHQISYNFPAGTTNLNGDFTAGEDPAIPNQVPTYISNSDGAWSDNTIWTPVGASPPCPIGGPNGYNVIVQDSVYTTTNHCFAYTTTINPSGKLCILTPTYGHNFGTVEGDSTLGAGTVYLQSGNLPAGDFTAFLDCGAHGTIEYGGTGTYTIVLNGFTTLPNLFFSGTGTRVLPNSDLTICSRLVIDGPTLNNSVSNKKLTIQGTMERYNTGAFTAGTGSGATVTFWSATTQTVGGPTGDFTGASAFNNFEVIDSTGLNIGANGTIEVSGNLLLTYGNITTSATNTLSILNTASTAVVPTGGSTSSYINGPLKKQIINGNSFNYPLGKGAVKGHAFTITSTSAGTTLFTAEFFTPNSTSGSVTAPLVIMNSLEYWGVSTTAAKTAKIDIAWDSQSDLNGTMTTNGITDLQVSEYNAGTSSWVGLTSTTSGVNNAGDAITTSSVNLTTTTINYSLGSLTNKRPTATLSPIGSVCGTAGIPVTFTTPVPITLNYTLSYKLNGVDQTPIVVSALPFSLPTPTPGTYQLTGFTYNNSSISGAVDATIITDYASPTTSAAGPNQSICGATSLNLPGNLPAIGTGLWTIVSGTSGWFNTPDATNYNALFGGPPGHTYTLKWTITNSSCTSNSTITVSFPYAPAQPSVFTAAPTPVCQGAIGKVYTVPAVAGATSYSWSYSGSGAVITGTGNSVSVNFSSTATSGNMSVSAVNGCGPGTARTVAVTVVPMPVATFSYAGSPYCQGGVNPTPTYSGGGAAGTFSSTAGLVFVSTATGEIDLTLSSPGTYTVTNTISTFPCSIVTANSSVTIYGFGNWLGGVSDDWLDPNNWICATVPTAVIDVNIPNGAPFMPLISASGAVCRSINLNSGSTLTISGNSNLDIYGNWTNNGTFSCSSGIVSFNSIDSVFGSSVTTFNNIIITPAGNLYATSTNMNVSGDWTNNGSFTSSNIVGFTGSATQTIGGTSLTTFNNVTINNNNATGINLNQPTTINGTLTMTYGLVNTTATNLLILSSTASTSIGNVNCYVNGPMAYDVAANGATTINFPIGKSTTWRPAILTVTHSSAAAATYTSEIFNFSPNIFGYGIPATIDRISDVHYWQIDRTGAANFTDATTRLYYDTLPNDDGVTDFNNLTVVKTIGTDTVWYDVNGTATADRQGSILSGVFSSFSKFTLGNRKGGVNPLPIELIAFNAKFNNDKVDLNWATAAEINNAYFTIERSSDGFNFETVTDVEGAGNSTTIKHYSAVDENPFEGRSYYRLKQTDFDGKFKLTDIISVNNSKMDLFDFYIFPNPTSNENINLNFTGNKNEEVIVFIYDLYGRMVYTNDFRLNSNGNNIVKLYRQDDIIGGVYYIVATNNTKLVTRKIVLR